MPKNEMHAQFNSATTEL